MRVMWRILGEFAGRRGDEAIPLGHARQRCVLAVLLMAEGRPVPVGRLIERVWGDHRSSGAQGTLYGYLSRLRLALAGADNARIVRSAGGYALQVDTADVDVYQYRDLIARARSASDDTDADALFASAFRLWQGEPFGSLSTPWLDEVREELGRERLAAELDHADVLLRLGRPEQVLDAAAARTDADPLDERVVGQLMRALHGCGRTAQALARYDTLRVRLATELGIEPGGPIQALYRQLLDPAPTSTAEPRQLPRRPWPFSGRRTELRALGDPTASGHGALWVIDGTGGVGKTWLALHWAHTYAAAFPDGHLYVDLRGFGPTAAVVDPANALRGFLVALGVPARELPERLDGLTGLYRSRTAGRRLLVVLDNARDVAQVRPLLPSSAQSTVVVTSRNRLTGLVTADGARSLSLDLLSRTEALELLTLRLGRDRVDADPAAIDDIIDLCERLPLALAIVAARAATYPDVHAAGIAARLRSSGTGLDRFATDDLSTDLRTVLSWSYHALDDGTARLFRLIGLFPGRDISTTATASLSGLAPSDAQARLDQLTRVHLLTHRIDGRHAMHDLVHAYARERVDHDEQPGERRAALVRLLDHYLHSAHTAAMLLLPYRQSIELQPPHPDVHLEPPTDQVAARTWFTAELPALQALVALAADSGLDAHTWQLAWTIDIHLARTGFTPHQHYELYRTALVAATRLGDRTGQGNALRSLGKVCRQLNRLDESVAFYRQAVDVFAALADPGNEGQGHMGIALIAEEQGDWDLMLTHTQHALRLFRASGNEGLIAVGLNAVGWSYVQHKQYELAAGLCMEALETAQRLGEIETQAMAADSLAGALACLGHDEQAVEYFQHAIDLVTQIDDRYFLALIGSRLGDHHHQAGRTKDALIHWQRALAIYDDLGHHRAVDLRERIANSGLDPDPGTNTPTDRHAARSHR